MTSVTTTQHNIKHRQKPNDKVYTPKALVKIHFEELSEYISPIMGIDPCLYEFGNKILDPCAGDGAYERGLKEWFANHLLQNNEKDYFDYQEFPYTVETNEITQGKDFFKNEYVGDYNLIIGNLPFSLTEKFLIKSAELKPDIISYLMPLYALTPARIEMMEQKGYQLIKIKQFKWYVCMGMCCFATWFRDDFKYLLRDEKGGAILGAKVKFGPKVDFTYDRTVWYKIDVWAKKRAKQKAREEKEEEKRIKKLNALRKKVAKSAASIGKKKHKKWWCETMEIFSKVPTYKITCNVDINPYRIQDEMWKWSYKTKKPKSGRKLWGENW